MEKNRTNSIEIRLPYTAMFCTAFTVAERISTKWRGYFGYWKADIISALLQAVIGSS